MSYLQLCEKKYIQNDLIEKLNLKNIHEIPTFNKIILKISKKGKSIIEPIMLLELISLQKPSLKKTKKSIAAFNIREKLYHSTIVTLRKNSLFEFLLQYIFFTIPNIKQYTPISENKISKEGNITISIKELNYFPFISEEYYKKFKNSYGMDLSFVMNFSNNTKTKILFSAYQMLTRS